MKRAQILWDEFNMTIKKLRYKQIKRSGFIVCIVVILFITGACNRRPKVIVQSGITDTNVTGMFAPVQNMHKNLGSNTNTEKVHKVLVHEVLPTSKYVYLYVTEGSRKYWMATMKQQVQIGNTYYYSDGLLQTNFKSAKYKRVFDTVYLVSKLMPENHCENMAGSKRETAWDDKHVKAANKNLNLDISHKGSISIAEVVKNGKKYEGKTVQVSGKCVKINANIMNRNWIHLKDGSGNDIDLLITSDKFIHVGTQVTMRGTVVLNKDFGAGYRYDILLENGELVK
jgi:hypothetical protein